MAGSGADLAADQDVPLQEYFHQSSARPGESPQRRCDKGETFLVAKATQALPFVSE